MSVKQDRAAPRTVADLEMKYNFGKNYAELEGIVLDTRNEVTEAKSELTNVKNQTSELSRTASELKATFKTVVDDGETTVQLETGYVFDADGLRIGKSGEQMSNLLDNTGMYVQRSGQTILEANGKGVTATDLHAKTYLKIGSGDGRCRFEDYGLNRIGCFWTGG
jgi:HSP90 family molecular chaperone